MLPKGWDKIQGWFSESEAKLLQELCAGTWCEVGCHHGRSTVVLAATGYDGYAIDTWMGSPEMPRVNSYTVCKRNLDEYENVIMVQKDFREIHECLLPELQLLHLDADHSYEMTKLAFDLFSPKVLDDGYVCFHDARGGPWPGVERVTQELVRDGGWKWVDEARTLVALQRQ